jgi:hypothetical protein
MILIIWKMSKCLIYARGGVGGSEMYIIDQKSSESAIVGCTGSLMEHIMERLGEGRKVKKVF